MPELSERFLNAIVKVYHLWGGFHYVMSNSHTKHIIQIHNLIDNYEVQCVQKVSPIFMKCGAKQKLSRLFARKCMIN